MNFNNNFQTNGEDDAVDAVGDAGGDGRCNGGSVQLSGCGLPLRIGRTRTPEGRLRPRGVDGSDSGPPDGPTDRSPHHLGSAATAQLPHHRTHFPGEFNRPNK